ncbi:hypothetical protein GIB67_016966 [Kingdonia uniflora]|uniref:UBA domain-containing protein n=1 Tax=Kingdonia uniflora TaxID=39325 RepID=A0A7J7M3S7_9MAGN|nr:hypothetical protein GIB67_016966 [Kingdonia uniflora]
MSPASKSKSKDKIAAKLAAKEQQKALSKPSAPNGTPGTGVMASAYNPLLGTFHTLDTAPTASSPPPHGNGRYRNIDENDDHSGSSLGTGAEYDSVSNNDSCSGESEDLKEKTITGNAVRLAEVIPGSDNDKREKIRQKNERKHQRQRERRAQELHEKCSGYLMSRKLEALSQQLVAMGFSSERSTMALILNEGRIEESVNWLFEAGEEEASQKESSKKSLDSGGNLKIDITEELNRVTDMEKRFKLSKQEVERAIVSCEGDLEKAADSLKALKQEPPPVSPSKSEEVRDLPVVNGGTSKFAVSSLQNTMRPQIKNLNSPVTIQQRRDERDFNYAKPILGTAAASSPELANRNLQSLRSRVQAKSSEWARPLQVAAPAAEKRWMGAPAVAGSTPSVSYSLAPPHTPQKSEVRYVEVKNGIQNGGTLREPVIMMQRPQSINNLKQNLNSNPGWMYSNTSPSVEIMKSSNVGPTPTIPSPPTSQPQFYHQQPRYQQLVGSHVDSCWSGLGPTAPSTSSALAPPSSLGLFSGSWGSAGQRLGSSSPVDWNTGGSMQNCDYTNIDWTLESSASSSLSRQRNGLLVGFQSFMNNNNNNNNSTRMYDSSTTRPVTSINGGVGGGIAAGGPSETSSSAASTSSEGGGPPHEWTSPFAGTDLLSLPRSFVTSPSL